MTSGVIFECGQHGFVAERVDAPDQSSRAFQHRKAKLGSLWRCAEPPESKVQTFFNQAGQRGALLHRRSLGREQQFVVDIERGFHLTLIQISVSNQARGSVRYLRAVEKNNSARPRSICVFHKGENAGARACLRRMSTTTSSGKVTGADDRFGVLAYEGVGSGHFAA